MLGVTLANLNAVSYASLCVRDIIDSGCCRSSVGNLPEAVCTINFSADDSSREVGKNLLEFVVVVIHGSLGFELATSEGCTATLLPGTPCTNHLHLLLHLDSKHLAWEILDELEVARNIQEHPARLTLVWEPLDLDGRVWHTVLVAVRACEVEILAISLAAVGKPPVDVVLVEVEDVVVDCHTLREMSLDIGNELLNRIQHVG